MQLARLLAHTTAHILGAEALGRQEAQIAIVPAESRQPRIYVHMKEGTQVRTHGRSICTTTPTHDRPQAREERHRQRCQPHILPQFPARPSHRQESPLRLSSLIPLDESRLALATFPPEEDAHGAQDPHGRLRKRTRPAQLHCDRAGQVSAYRWGTRLVGARGAHETACRGDRPGGI